MSQVACEERAHRSTQGVALINAIVVVSLIAAFSALMLSRSFGGAKRLSEVHHAGQLALLLDAATLLAPEVLAANLGGQRSFSVHSEAYGKTYDVPVLDGRIKGQVVDLQSRFNLAWLKDPDNLEAQSAFLQLWKSLQFPEEKHAAFVQAIRQEGSNRDNGAVLVVGHWVGLHGFSVRQAGLTPEQRVLLNEHAAHLSDDATININTAPLVILHAFFPDIAQESLQEVLGARERAAFANVRELQFRLGAYLPRDVIAKIDFGHFDTTSDWFQVNLIAERNGLIASSQLVLRRNGSEFQSVSTVAP